MRTFILIVTVSVVIAVAGALIATLVYSIRRERAQKLWKNFGLSHRLLRVLPSHLDRPGVR